MWWGWFLGVFSWVGLAAMFFCVKRGSTEDWVDDEILEIEDPLRSNPEWHPDPTRRYYQRYHDGYFWTDDVCDIWGHISRDEFA